MIKSISDTGRSLAQRTRHLLCEPVYDALLVENVVLRTVKSNNLIFRVELFHVDATGGAFSLSEALCFRVEVPLDQVFFHIVSRDSTIKPAAFAIFLEVVFPD
jgi:hypothetical protein